MAGDTEKPGELAGLNPTSTAADLELAEGLSIFRNFRSEVHRVLAPNLDVLVHQRRGDCCRRCTTGRSRT